ncbi:uncharacterized protein LOC144453831 [Glandiceps talaboti]
METILAGDELEYDIVDIELESLLADDASPCAQLAHRMALGTLNKVSLQQKCQTTKKLPLLLHCVSSAVCCARQLVSEMEHIKFWHQVEISNTCISVQFSSVLAKTKFIIIFELIPGKYPWCEVQHNFVNKIGKMRTDMVTSRLSSVKPGFKYLIRLVASIDELLKKPVSL